jgi:hypothetical protein
MGTSNFARGNTSRVFAVLMNEDVYVCSECGAYHYEENPECCEGATYEEESRAVEQYDVEDFEEFVREVAKESAPKDIQYSKEDGRDRNASNLFSYRMSKWYGDLEVELQIVAKMVSGYYEGASLDFEFTIFDGYEFSDSDDAVEYLFGNNCSCMNQGLLKIQQRHAERWADRTKSELTVLIEQVFEQVSMPLRVVATFSNGETIYEKL